MLTETWSAVITRLAESFLSILLGLSVRHLSTSVRRERVKEGSGIAVCWWKGYGVEDARPVALKIAILYDP